MYSSNSSPQVLGPLIQALCIISIVCCSSGCSRRENPSAIIKNSYQADSLNDLILDNLRTKKIVMIGDASHENGYYMRLVTGALDRWLDQLEKTPSPNKKVKHDLPPLPKKLFLFIEADSERVSTIRQYMHTGDISNFLMLQIHGETKWGSIVGGVSVDVMEYFQRLKQIEKRVQKLNAEDASHPYDFLMIGPEGIPPYNYTMTKDPKVWREQYHQAAKGNFNYFVRKRDEVSSGMIRKTLSDHPDYKAIVFYGTAHLLRGRQNKASVGRPVVEIDTAYGYYVAHYLDQYFSRDSVSIFFTYHYPGTQSTSIQNLEQSSTTPDYEVLCNPIPSVQCPLEIINCRTTLHVLYTLMNKSSSGYSEEDQILSRAYSIRLYYQLKRSYLNSGSDTRPMLKSLRQYMGDTNTTAMKKRNEIVGNLIARFDAIKNITSLSEWITMPLGDSLHYLPILKMVLKNIPSRGPLAYITKPFENITLNDSAKSIIKPYTKDLIEYFLVQLLWIGTPDETKRAQKELQARTGLHLQTAREWSDWWRSNYAHH